MNIEDKREQFVKEKIQELLSEKGTMYPFSLKNFTEALQNFDDAIYIYLAAICGTAASLPNNEIAQDLNSKAIIKAVRIYWEKIAETETEKSVPTAQELEEQELESLRDLSRRNIPITTEVK